MIASLDRIPGGEPIPDARQIRSVAESAALAATGGAEGIVALAAVLIAISGKDSAGNARRLHKTGTEVAAGEKRFVGQVRADKVHCGEQCVLPIGTLVGNRRPLFVDEVKDFEEVTDGVDGADAAAILDRLGEARYEVAQFARTVGLDPSVHSGDQAILYFLRFASAVFGLPNDVDEYVENESVPIDESKVEEARDRIVGIIDDILDDYESETGVERPVWVRVMQILERYLLLKKTVGASFPEVEVNPEDFTV